jgi:hypothetical protein
MKPLSGKDEEPFLGFEMLRSVHTASFLQQQRPVKEFFFGFDIPGEHIAGVVARFIPKHSRAAEAD